jgi:outer membrane receptor for monomeric catechols
LRQWRLRRLQLHQQGREKSPLTAQALLQGRFATGSVKHELTVGASFFKNSEKWGDYLYDWSASATSTTRWWWNLRRATAVLYRNAAATTNAPVRARYP